MDWSKIQQEYVTTQISYRALAEKYGVPLAPMVRRAQAENWVALRRAGSGREDPQLTRERAQHLLVVADKLLGKVEQVVEMEDALQPGAIKTLSDALKNIRDAQMLKHPKDILEQDAKIAKLRKEVRKETGDSRAQVTICLEEAVEGYAE